MSMLSDRLQGESPEQVAATLESIKDAVAGEQPLMRDPPPTTVTLFRGLYSNGTWLQDAVVRELTGVDEEAIARMQSGATQSPGQFLNAMLAWGTSSIGTLDLSKLGLQERVGTLDTLLVGEKELLFLNILRVTYGDQRTVAVRCGTCGAINDVHFSITDDVPIRTMEDPRKTTYEFTCRSGQHIEFRLVTGSDNTEVAKKPNLTTPEQNTIIFSRCVVSVDGKPPVDPLHFARNMTAFDRRHLLDTMNELQPGPSFEEVKLPCATCGAESTFTPQWADLLSP